MPALAASWMTGQGVSSRSSHSDAAGRMTSVENSCSHFWSVCWSSVSWRVKPVVIGLGLLAAAGVTAGNSTADAPVVSSAHLDCCYPR